MLIRHFRVDISWRERCLCMHKKKWSFSVVCQHRWFHWAVGEVSGQGTLSVSRIISSSFLFVPLILWSHFQVTNYNYRKGIRLMNGLIVSALKLILNNWKGSLHVTLPREFNSLWRCLITRKFWDSTDTNVKCLKRLGVSLLTRTSCTMANFVWELFIVRLLCLTHYAETAGAKRRINRVLLQGYKTLFPPGILFLPCC